MDLFFIGPYYKVDGRYYWNVLLKEHLDCPVDVRAPAGQRVHSQWCPSALQTDKVTEFIDYVRFIAERFSFLLAIF